MNDNFGSTHIYLKYQNKVKKLNWRKNLTSEDFSYLIKSIYGLQGKILGFQANDGTIYELSYLISHRDHISNTPYQIIVRPEQSQSRLYHHMIEMKSLKNFEEILEKLPKESLKIISIFSEIDQLFDEAMEKLENIAQDYQEEICQFYWLIISLSDRSLSKRIFSLTPPLLVFYSGEEKFLEIPINELSLHKVSKLLSRVQQEKQSSIYNIDQSDHSTTSINSFYIIEENTQRDSEFVSQETYVMDSNSSINTFELKSQTSDVDERKSTEIFDIEEKTEVNDIALQNCQFNDENIYEKEFILDGKKLDFKKKSVEPIKESYFLQPNKKTSLPPLDTSIKQENNNKILNNINGAQEEDIGSLSPCKYTDFYSLLHDNVGKFEPEDYGMAVCLYKEKNKELFDLLNDCRKLNDKDLNSFLVSNFAKKKFSLWLIDNFSRDSIEKLSNEKFFKNSGVYTAYQCFKYDNDLEDLKAMLEKALKKEDKDEILPKPTDSIVENEYSDYINNVDVDLIKKFGQDLHPIKEGSEKDEESPGMPMDYNLGVYEKKTETKYKEMVMAMKDSNLEKKADGSGFNLMLVGNGDSGLLPEKSKKKKGGLKIDCPKDEHPLARKVLEKFFDQGEMEKNLEAYQKLKRKLKLAEDETETMNYLFEQRDPALLHVVNQFKTNEKQIGSLEKELRDILNINKIAISSSPRSIKKIQIFNLFKTTLEDLYKEHLINSTQMKLCLYLFMKIDMSILSSFEVFQLTQDRDDFLDSLNLIYKINYVKLEQQLDDIEEYDDITEIQLKIVYAFQADLELSERTILETVVKAQDQSLLKLHEEYRKFKNKPDFIKKVKELCCMKNKQLKEIKVIMEKAENSNEELKNRRRNLVETCKIHRFLKEVTNMAIILDAIEKNDPIMEAICSVYELTLDKQDFTESVRAFYKVRTNLKILCLVEEIIEEKHWSQLDLKIVSDAVLQGNKVISAAYQLWEESKDDYDREELIDTLEKFIKLQKNK